MAWGGRVQTQHAQLTLEASQAENRLQGGRLARAVRSYEPDDTAGLHRETHVFQRVRRAIRLLQPPSLNYLCHHSALEWRGMAPWARQPRYATGRWSTSRGAEWWRRPSATLPRGSVAA